MIKKKKENEDIEFVEEEGGVEQKIDKLKKDVQACKKEKAEYLDGWQRARADLINYKKEERERNKTISQFVTEEMAHELLPVLDSFDLALQYDMGSEAEKGIVMIRGQLEEALKRRGMEAIEVKTGDPFDMTIHESIGEVESDAPEGIVAEEVQKGYTMHGKVVRASKVKLAKKKENS